MIFNEGLEVTDEISAVERVEGKVVLVPNDEPNFKITIPQICRWRNSFSASARNNVHLGEGSAVASSNS